jgi:hypothetical protein
MQHALWAPPPSLGPSRRPLAAATAAVDSFREWVIVNVDSKGYAVTGDEH